MCKYIPESKYTDLNVTSEYSLISACTVTYPENGIYRLTASQMYYNAEPRGILITDSSTDYSEYHLMSKYETSARENIIATSITRFATGGKTVYVFAKALSTGNNRITITLERLG